MINESFANENPDQENLTENETKKRVSVQIETAMKSSKFLSFRIFCQPTQLKLKRCPLSIFESSRTLWPKLLKKLISRGDRVFPENGGRQPPAVRLSARFNKGVTENRTQSQLWLSRLYLISCGSFIANFEPALKSRIFEIAILKITTVLYHVKISLSGWARMSLVFLYVVRNKYFNQHAKN